LWQRRWQAGCGGFLSWSGKIIGSYRGGQFVEGGRQCVVVDVDKVHGGWIYRKGEAGESV
jgi:hypothetical protein